MAKFTKRDNEILKNWKRAYEMQEGVFAIAEVVEVDDNKRTIVTGLKPGYIETDKGIYAVGTVRKAHSEKEQLDIYTIFD